MKDSGGPLWIRLRIGPIHCSRAEFRRIVSSMFPVFERTPPSCGEAGGSSELRGAQALAATCSEAPAARLAEDSSAWRGPPTLPMPKSRR